MGLLICRQRCRSPEWFSLRFGARQTGLGALNQEITFELGYSVDHTHGQLSRRTGQIDAA